jgi:integrase
MYYNEELKFEFIDSIKESYLATCKNVFNKSSFLENELNKDIYEFTIDELAKLMISLTSKSLHSSRNRNYVLHRYLDFNKNSRKDRTNPLVLVDANWHEQFIKGSKDERGLITEQDLDEIIAKSVNAQDSVIYRLLFEGVCGEECCELRNLKKDDINWRTRTLTLYDDEKGKRQIQVSEKCIKLLEEAAAQKEYELSNGESTRTQQKPLFDNDYVIRTTVRKDNDPIERCSYTILRNRIRNLEKAPFNYPHLRTKTIGYSGMLKEAVNISIQYNVPVKEFNHKSHWIKVAEKFNVEPTMVGPYAYPQYLGITNNVNAPLVEELYGDLSEFIIPKFELVDETGIDIEMVRRKKRVASPSFKRLLISAYKKCAVTEESYVGVLEACHIQPYIKEESNHIQNGILLRADIHKLFDSGLMTVNEDYVVQVSPSLKSTYYQSFHGKKIHLPENRRHYPSKEALNYNMSIFKVSL